MVAPRNTYGSMAEFYPFYLSQHSNKACRQLHFAGTTLSLFLLLLAIYLHNGWLIPLAILQGYAWAWVGHFFFEHNRPATFTHPIYSFVGDWWMWFDMLRGRIKF